MAAADAVVLVASVVACVAAVVVLGAAFVLVGKVRTLERTIERLSRDTAPLLESVRRAADRLADGDGRTAAAPDGESSAAPLGPAPAASAAGHARRALATPVVKVLAMGAGTAGGLRRLREPPC
ncbi:MAG: hypothetical protein ACRDWN_02355 [Acidimicrobiales bacterium]